MVMLQTTAILKLRVNPGLIGEVAGYFHAGTLVYAVGGLREADGMTWLNVAGPCQDGTWRDGWCASGMDGSVFLSGYELPGWNLDYPLGKTTPITQMFGENPDTYSKLGYAGHNGLDFGCPVGTPVVAIDSGAITHARSDPAGYGHYIRIDHTWGITVYAHLSRFFVEEGGWVGRGATIGASGNSGMSTGAHLHLDMRVFPCNDANGFGGRIDPLPFLPASRLVIPDYVPDSLRELIGKP